MLLPTNVGKTVSFETQPFIFWTELLSVWLSDVPCLPLLYFDFFHIILLFLQEKSKQYIFCCRRIHCYGILTYFLKPQIFTPVSIKSKPTVLGVFTGFLMYMYSLEVLGFSLYQQSMASEMTGQSFYAASNASMYGGFSRSVFGSVSGRSSPESVSEDLHEPSSTYHDKFSTSLGGVYYTMSIIYEDP